MTENAIIASMFFIFTGAAVFATLALFTRQSLLVAYILLGALVGPWGVKFVNDLSLVRQVADIGIIFLLFLLGLNLHPQNLWKMLRNTTWVALISSCIFAIVGFALTHAFGFSIQESVIIGVAMMFSSTIIGLKLLPTTVLHHQRMGSVVISILLLQDLIAIIVLLVLHGASSGGLSWWEVVWILLALPGITLFCFFIERFVLLKLLARFDRVQEYVFLVAIGWCLGVSELAVSLGLTHEIGAFLAGVSIASSPIALYIAESLKPLRDFFLVMFFFALGANFDFGQLSSIAVPAFVLAATMLLLKPAVFRYLLVPSEKGGTAQSWEIGVRLGQISEFSLLIAYLSHETHLLGESSFSLIQATTLLTFIASSYYIGSRYATPITLDHHLHRD